MLIISVGLNVFIIALYFCLYCLNFKQENDKNHIDFILLLVASVLLVISGIFFFLSACKEPGYLEPSFNYLDLV
jgi:hypothetical protein